MYAVAPAAEAAWQGLIAHIAEEAGISALTIHGRTRADFYDGHAEYETIAGIWSVVSAPSWAEPMA